LLIVRFLVFQVKEDKTLGRHLVASKDIKEGEIISKERPLVIGPSQVNNCPLWYFSISDTFAYSRKNRNDETVMLLFDDSADF
jgi:sialic acid synthase SpsE